MVPLGGLAWLKRDSLRSWYYVRQLKNAAEADRDRWAERVASLGEAALPSLIDCLIQPNERICANAGAALTRLGGWQANDGRVTAAMEMLRGEWERLSPAGRRALLTAVGEWLRKLPEGTAPAEGLVSATKGLLAAVLQDQPDVQAPRWSCATRSAPCPAQDVRPIARELVRTSLSSPSAEVRLHAVRTAQRPGMDLIGPVAGLLADPSVEVRRAAVRAVGPPDKDVLDDVLLPCLHDTDAEVRHLAEAALTETRGLSPVQVRLGWLLTHPQFLVRTQVLDELRRLNADMDTSPSPVDAALWLRRMSNDPMPSVRAAAARMMAEQPNEDLAERARRDGPRGSEPDGMLPGGVLPQDCPNSGARRVISTLISGRYHTSLKRHPLQACVGG